MFSSLMALEGLRLRGSDHHDVGRVQDALVDAQWAVRYLVVTSGSWLGRDVVVSPIAVAGLDWADARLDVTLTQEQVRSSPDLLAVTPLTRSAEAAYSSHYGIPAYWGGPGLWAWAGSPGALGGVPPTGYLPPEVGIDAAPLDRAGAFRGRHLTARDGQIGHVDDGLIDQESWTVPYLLVDTSNWIGGKHVLVPTAAVRDRGSVGRNMTVDLTTDRIRSSPEYDRTRPIDSTFEGRLRAHYGSAAQPQAAPVRIIGSGR
jgi:uncharacterized protein YifN (PemK superfamily)